MSFFLKETRFYSPINGELILRRYFWGKWFLKISEGEYYSGSYLEKMWKAILKKYLKKFGSVDSPIKSGNDKGGASVLVLGCGAGCAIEAIKNLWPNVFSLREIPRPVLRISESEGGRGIIDALDYDPTMIEIGKKIYPYTNINFIISDAAEFVEKCEKKYNLIIIDIFYKNKPSPLLKDKDFISNIHRILEKPGTVLVNFATKLSGEDEEIPKAWNSLFLESKQLNFRSNKIFAAEKSNTPPDYFSIYQSRLWSRLTQKKGLTVAGQERAFICIQWLPFGLGIVNAAHTDKEPDIQLIKNLGCRHGIIFWSQWERRLAPRPWKRSPFALHLKGNGLSVVSPDYHQKWSQMARRNLKKFQTFSVNTQIATADAFIQGLKFSTLKPSLQKAFTSMIDNTDDGSMELVVARIPLEANFLTGQENGKIVGGLAVINYANISAHFVAFLTREGQKCQAGVGLIDWWYRYALERQIKYLNFGHIRQKWEPWSWQGYSDFKRKFIDKEIRLANGWWRVF